MSPSCPSPGADPPISSSRSTKDSQPNVSLPPLHVPSPQGPKISPRCSGPGASSPRGRRGITDPGALRHALLRPGAGRRPRRHGAAAESRRCPGRGEPPLGRKRGQDGDEGGQEGGRGRTQRRWRCGREKNGGVEETKHAEAANAAAAANEAAAAAAAAALGDAAASISRSSPNGLGGGGAEPAEGGGGNGSGSVGVDGPAERAEALAFAFVGRALEASGGNCLGPRELTAVAEAFRDDPTPAKFGFMELLLRWASLQEEEGEGAPSAVAGGQGDEGAVAAWTKTGPLPAALREGLLQALHGAADDKRRDSALALLASLLRAVGQEWAVEVAEEDTEEGVGGKGGSGNSNTKEEKEEEEEGTAARRKRGTFVAFAVRCAAGEVRILLDEALSLFVPPAARGVTRVASGGNGDDDEAGPGTGQKARGAMGPAGADPSIGIAAEIAGANAASAAAAGAAATAAAGKDCETRGEGGKEGEAPPPRTPLSPAQLRAIKERRAARLLRMVPVALGVAESTIAFLCGGEGAAEDGEGGKEGGGGPDGRWDELPIDTLQDLQKVGLFLSSPRNCNCRRLDK